MTSRDTTPARKMMVLEAMADMQQALLSPRKGNLQQRLRADFTVNEITNALSSLRNAELISNNYNDRDDQGGTWFLTPQGWNAVGREMPMWMVAA